MDNIWSWFLNGFIWLVQMLILPLFGDSTSQASALNLGGAIGGNTMILFQLIWLSFSVFNLTWIGIYLGIAFTLKGIQLVVAVWFFIKNLIPFIN